MKIRFRLIRRNLRGGTYYCQDTLTGTRTSLQTTSKDEAAQIVQAKNQALRQPFLNLQIAKAYLAGSNSGTAGCKHRSGGFRESNVRRYFMASFNISNLA